MSANNQILVKEYERKFYLFRTMAESWGDGKNEVSISESLANYPSLAEAVHGAHSLDDTEYGVHIDLLSKDGAGVIINGDKDV